jgi:hypothetical protein
LPSQRVLGAVKDDRSPLAAAALALQSDALQRRHDIDVPLPVQHRSRHQSSAASWDVRFLVLIAGAAIASTCHAQSGERDDGHGAHHDWCQDLRTRFKWLEGLRSDNS